MDNFDSEKFIIINDQNTDLKIIDSNTKLIIFDLKKNTDNNLMITLGGLFPRSFTDNLKKYMKQDELDELALTHDLVEDVHAVPFSGQQPCGCCVFS